MLMYRKQLTSRDRQRLAETLEQAADGPFAFAPEVEALRTLLRRSEVLPDDQVPCDMITMNSRFVVSDQLTDQRRLYALVYPEDEAPWLGRISILSHMGQALLGAREGEEVCWLTATEPVVLRVERVLYQPQAAEHEYAEPTV